jgi:hypothetical protein
MGADDREASTCRREDIVQPGDVRIFDKGEKSLVVAIGVWAKRQGSAIHIHLTGPEKFHTTVTNQKGSERYHRTLFRNLRRLLIEEGRWPFGKEGEETEGK